MYSNVLIFKLQHPHSDYVHIYIYFTVNFIDKHWKALIDRVNNVDPILDVLRQEKVITNEDYCTIRAKETPQKKMRELLTQITSAGDKGKEVLYEALKENNKFLMDDLEKAQ